MDFFSYNDIPGHVSYAIMAASFIMTNMLWLRILAVVGLAMEMTYFALTSPDLYVGLFWDSVLIAINLYRLVALVRDRFGLKLTGDQKALLKSTFGKLDKAQFAQLLKVGAWIDLADGERLTREGAHVAKLYLIGAGRVGVEVGGAPVAQLHGGSFVGEMAFLTGRDATATVTALEPTRVLAFERDRLAGLAAKDPAIAAALHRALGSDLAQKLTPAASA